MTSDLAAGPRHDRPASGGRRSTQSRPESVLVPTRSQKRRARREAEGSGPRTERFTYLAVLAAAFTSPWTGARFAGFPLADAMTAIALLFLLWTLFARRPQLRLPLVAVVPTAVLLVIIMANVILRGQSLLSASTQLFNQYTVGSAVTAGVTGPGPMLARVALSTALVAFIISVFGSLFGKDSLQRLLLFWTLGAGVSACAAAAEPIFSLRGTPFLFQTTTIDRAIGLAFHPNSLAQSLTMALPSMLFFALRYKGLRQLFMLALTGVTLYAIVKSGSRAGLVAGAGALGISWVVFMVQSRRFVAGTVSLLGGVLVIIQLMPKILDATRFSSNDAGQSDQLRSGILQNGFQVWSAHPFVGSSVGVWMGECVPLIMLTSGGIFLFFAYYAPFAEVSLRLAPHRRDSFAALTLISLATLFAYGFINNGFGERYLFWPVYIGYEYFRHVNRERQEAADAAEPVKRTSALVTRRTTAAPITIR